MHTFQRNGTVYLTDFGLSLDKKFNLNDGEIRFINKNKKLDYYYLIDVVISVYLNKCMQKNMFVSNDIDKKDSISINKYFMDNIDKLKEDVQLNDYLVEFVKTNAVNYLEFIRWKRKMKETKDMKDKFTDDIVFV